MPQLAKNLLLGDDDRDDVELFQLALKEACIDYELTVAEAGNALLKMISEKIRPDAIVMDINLPMVSGIQCLDIT